MGWYEGTARIPGPRAGAFSPPPDKAPARLPSSTIPASARPVRHPSPDRGFGQIPGAWLDEGSMPEKGERISQIWRKFWESKVTGGSDNTLNALDKRRFSTGLAFRQADRLS